MAQQREDDFPLGHPARCDYDPTSPEAKEWARLHIHPKGERDFPVGHAKAVDTEGNTNHIEVLAGVDPTRPDLEAFTGRTPEQVEALRALYAIQSASAKESPAPQPIMASDPPLEVSVRRAMVFDDGSGVLVFCPGCKCGHKFDSRWAFNGSLELPTFTPSMLVESQGDGVRCHSYVTSGRIQFLEDTTHELRGQTVDLPAVAQMQETIHASRS